MSEAGTWTQEVEARCPCECPGAAVRVGYSQRVDVGEGFSDWSDYDYSNRLVASNSDTSTGGANVEVRVKIEITGNGVEGVVRFYQVTSSEVGDPPKTVYRAGEVRTALVPATLAVFAVDYEFEPCGIGEAAVLVGAPGRPSVELIGETQAASLHMKGFRAYTGDSPGIAIYRRETVQSGGDPGCASSGRPARAYSGAQSFEAAAATEASAWIADPAGTYSNSLSPDLIADKHASTPFGQVNATVDFGSQSYGASGDTKRSTEAFGCGSAVLQKTLALDLSEPYLTSDLTGAVIGALDTQQALGRIRPAGETSVVHRSFLSAGETFFDRVRTTSIGAAGGGLPDAAAGILGTLIDDGALLDLRLSCDVITRPLNGDSKTTTPRAFTARIYAEGALTGPDGRPARPPEGGEVGIPPDLLPWEEIQNAEVIIQNLRVTPNIRTPHLLPFTEPLNVLEEGVDGL